MLTGIAVTLVSWLALIVMFFGVGCLVMAALGRRPDAAESALATFWIGWAPVVALLQIWHVFAPIGPGTLGVTALLGGAGLLAQGAPIREGLVRVGRRASASPLASALAAGVVLLLVAWLANRAMAPITPPGDSGFYHIGAVRWIQAEPLLTGLGNVDGRFGFNNALFLYMAMLDWPAGPPHFYHLGMPILFLVFAAECAVHVFALARGGSAAEGRHLLGSLWVAAIVPYFFVELGSTSTDTANLLVGFVLGLHLFRLIFEPLSPRDAAFHALVVVVLATVGVTIKLSFAFLGFFACCVAGLCFLRARSDGFAAGLGPAVRAALVPIAVTVALVAVVLGTWLARGVAMTGYVAYPSTTALHLDVDWKVPEEQVVGEADAIKVWARFPFETEKTWDEILSGWDWLLPWLWKTLERVDVFTLPMLLFLVGAWVYGRRRRAESLDLAPALLFLASPTIAFVLWFVTAPAERFGGAIFWLLGAGVWSILFQQTASPATRRQMVRAAFVFVPITLLAAAIAGAVLSHGRYGFGLFVPPGSAQGFHPIPEAVVERHVSRSGLVHYVAVSMRPGSSAWVPGLRCWDAPLPCTIRPKPDLETREPGTWRSGFRLSRPD